MKEYFLENKTYYRINELKPDRLTLLFIHGVSGSSSAWFPYEKIFEDKYNVLTYDIRGHGMSKKYPDYSDYQIRDFVNDLRDLVVYLGLRKLILISNSFGGLVHLAYIKSYRKDMVANIFTSPEIYIDAGFPAKIIRLILKIWTEIITFLPFNPKPRGHVDYGKHINSTDWNIKRNLADMKNTGLRAHFYTLKQSFDSAKKKEYDLEKIDMPTLIMHGDKDSMVPIKNAIRMSKEIKNSEFISIPDVDHNTAHNAVKKISETIESFIDRNKKNLLY